MSLLQCINNTISLEIYLDSYNYAAGELYLDDGESTRNVFFIDHERTLMKYIFIDNVLSAARMLKDDHFAPAKNVKKVSKIQIFGLKEKPVSVKNLQTHELVDFDYSSERQTLAVFDLEWPVDNDELV